MPRLHTPGRVARLIVPRQRDFEFGRARGHDHVVGVGRVGGRHRAFDEVAGADVAGGSQRIHRAVAGRPVGAGVVDHRLAGVRVIPAEVGEAGLTGHVHHVHRGLHQHCLERGCVGAAQRGVGLVERFG